MLVFLSQCTIPDKRGSRNRNNQELRRPTCLLYLIWSGLGLAIDCSYLVGRPTQRWHLFLSTIGYLWTTLLNCVTCRPLFAFVPSGSNASFFTLSKQAQRWKMAMHHLNSRQCYLICLMFTRHFPLSVFLFLSGCRSELCSQACCVPVQLGF